MLHRPGGFSEVWGIKDFMSKLFSFFGSLYLQQFSVVRWSNGQTGGIYGEKDIQDGYVSPFI